MESTGYNTERLLKMSIQNKYFCRYCKLYGVEKVVENTPYIEEYWQCEKCDSTYPEWEYPKYPCLICDGNGYIGVYANICDVCGGSCFYGF